MTLGLILPMSLMHGGRGGADAQTRLPQGPGDGPASLHGPRCSGGGAVSADAGCWGPSSGSSALSDGSASRPGSCPPANFTSAWTRESTEGWVANRSAKPSRGLSTHNSITAEVAPGSSPRFSILRSAEIMASGFFVSSTEPASARYSRERDSASLTTCDTSQATTISTTAMMMTTMAPPPELLLSLDDEDDRDDEEDDGDDHQLHVAVLEVGQLVAQHRFDLLVVQRFQETGGDGDRILPRVEAGRERVQCWRIHDLQLRHGDAARDAEIFEQIVEPRLFLAGDVMAAGHRVDHRLMEEIGDDDPGDHRDRRKGRGFEQVGEGAAQIIGDGLIAV